MEKQPQNLTHNRSPKLTHTHLVWLQIGSVCWSREEIASEREIRFTGLLQGWLGEREGGNKEYSYTHHYELLLQIDMY